MVGRNVLNAVSMSTIAPIHVLRFVIWNMQPPAQINIKSSSKSVRCD